MNNHKLLLIRNPFFCIYYLIYLFSYLDGIFTLNPTLRILEFVKSLIDNRFPLTGTFFIRFVSSCLKCNENDIETIRYICIFLGQQVQKNGKLYPFKSYGIMNEIKVFAQKYSSVVKEAADLLSHVNNVISPQLAMGI